MIGCRGSVDFEVFGKLSYVKRRVTQREYETTPLQIQDGVCQFGGND